MRKHLIHGCGHAIILVENALSVPAPLRIDLSEARLRSPLLVRFFCFGQAMRSSMTIAFRADTQNLEEQELNVGAKEIVIRGAREHNLKDIRPHHSPGQTGCNNRSFRVGQIHAGL